MGTLRSRDGTGIAYERSGTGPPLILVDGAFCSRSLGPMPNLASVLQPHFTVFTYDRRGRNESGDTAPYAVDREIEDLAALVGEAGGSASVYGISSGAALALEAAARGLRMEKLALYEPPYVANGRGGPTPAEHEARLRDLVAAGRRGDAVRYFLRDMVGMPAPLVWGMRLVPMWSKLERVAHTLPYDAAVMGDGSVPAERAAGVRVPTLVMAGARSPAPLRQAARAVADAVPGARHRLLEGQGHNVSPRAVAPVLVEHFAG